MENKNEAVYINNCVLYNADCFDVFSLIEDDSVDAIICDLPYGTTACKWDSVLPLDKLWAEYKRVIKPNGAIVLTASQPFTSILITSNLSMYRYNWVWKKTRPSNFPNAKVQPMKYHEDICVFSEKKHLYYPIMIKGDKVRRKGGVNSYEGFNSCLANQSQAGKEYMDYYPSSIIEFANPNHNSVHPTQKPVALMEYLVRTYTNNGDTVLDNTMGSGTTGLACLNTNRKFIGIEKEKEYFDIAVNRLNTVQARLF